MNRWTDLLDAIRDGAATPPPPVVRTLRLPGIDGWEAGRVWGCWKVDPDVFHVTGSVFGGYLAALADTVLTTAMFTVLDHGEGFTTSDLRYTYFRPVREGTLRFEGSVVHRGKRTAYAEALFTRDDGKLVGKACANQIIFMLDA